MKSKYYRSRMDSYLTEHHFLPAERSEFRNLAKSDPALLQMVSQRDRQYSQFSRQAQIHRWVSVLKINTEWRKYITDFYKRNNWVNHFHPNKGSPSPWEWFRAKTAELPDELVAPQYRKRNQAQRSQRSIDGAQVTTRRWLQGLAESIKDATGSHKQDLIKQYNNLKKTLK